MNILRVIASTDPRDGGPVEGLRLSAAGMSRDGHATEVVTLDAPGAAHLDAMPLPVHACGPGWSRYRYTGRLARWIGEHGRRFDVAVVHGLWNHASVGGGRALRRAGLPYVVFAHGMMDPWFREAHPLKHVARQALWTAAQGGVLANAAAVLFTSDEEGRRASGAFRGHRYRERVVAYGAGGPPDRPAAQRAAFEALLPGVAGRRFLLFLGRLHPKKGCDLLIDAFADVAGAAPTLDLVIAGPDAVGWQGALEARTRALAVADRVHWPGMLAGDAKWGALRGADALVLPSHQENFGLAVAEAMACGTPVLISDRVNIWREVAAGGGGLVEADTADGVRRLLGRWLDGGPEQRAAMSDAARAGSLRHFHADAAARDLADALACAAAGRPP